ncbi:hypothetical protein M1247_28875 [Mycobacterium sp. 21AC1]|uniref:hypothetical protein n=1 Tax=[Mycobacterium] appelbergii TaxID=2939269 RepID=UPI0029393FBE|nr:hypothetical protein [Mycobacterium sp. 21AC1]MDV3128951.1 hypothetical protein [Mycobacterium sp. 21AC1]
MWAKIPSATASIACAACITAAAVAVPVVKSTTDYGLAKTIAAEVNLTAINFGALDWLNAIPQYQAILGGTPEEKLAALGELELTSAIPAYAALLSDGDLSALEDVDLLSAVPAYAKLLDGDLSGLGDLDSTSAIPSYIALASGEGTVENLIPLESVNGLYSFSKFPEEGFEAFVPTEDEEGNVTNPGYAALSGVSSWQKFAAGDVGALGGIDAFSAIPNYLTLADPEATPGAKADAIRGLDSVSAIPEYLGLPTAAEAKAAAGTNTLVAKTAAPEETEAPAEEPTTPTTPLGQVKSTLQSALGPQGSVTPKVSLPAAGAVEALTPKAPEAAPEPKESKSTSSTKTAKPAEETEKGTSAGGSYSGVFKPKKEEILFGSGKGNGADNGIRGWGEGLKKLGIGGGDDAGSADGGDSGGDGGE